MKHLVIAFLFLTLTGCGKRIKEEQVIAQDSIIKCSPNLQFDKIEHYKITQMSKWEGREAEGQSTPEDKVLNLLFEFYPTSLSDPVISAKLSEMGFSEWEVSKNDYQRICEIFNDPYKDQDSTACSPVFRDIIVFKNRNVVSGFAKCCFSCGHSMVLLKSEGDSIRNVNLLKLKEVLH